MSISRKRRVAELLRSFLAMELIELQDPRLTLVTVTAVRVSADLKSARVYWTVPGSRKTKSLVNGEEDDTASDESIPFPTEEEISLVKGALEKASGVLKKRIGEGLKLRYTPTLRFEYDSSFIQGARIDELLDKVKSND